MLGHAAARQPASMLALRLIGRQKRVGPGVLASTLGSVIGSSIASSLQQPSAAETEAKRQAAQENFRRMEIEQQNRDAYNERVYGELVGALGDAGPGDRTGDVLVADAGSKGAVRRDSGDQLRVQNIGRDAGLDRVSERARLRSELEQLQRNVSDLRGVAASLEAGNARRGPFDIEITGTGLKPPSEGFLFGLDGGQRSVLEGPMSFSEKAGLLTRGVITGPLTSAYGLAREIGAEYGDVYNLMTRSGESFTPSSALFDSLQREGVGGTLLNVGHSVFSAPTQPVFDLLDGRYEQAGAGLTGTVSAAFGLARLGGQRLGATSSAPWENFSPNVNWEHVFTGELRAGKQGELRALGYHHESEFSPDTVRVIDGSRTAIDANGVYRARVTIQDPATGAWINKQSPSTFFPRSWTPDQVNAEVMSAFENKVWYSDAVSPTALRRWDGIGASGLRVRGYFHNGRIDTVFPIFSGQP